MQEETMADFTAELEASFKKIRQGDILTGTVIAISETEVTLDLQYYTEGIIRLEDYSEEPGFSFKDKVAIGDELSATVIRRDDGEGHILMSRKEANDIQAWDKLQEMMDQQTVINVKINAVVNAGVIAYVEGIRGFIPASKLSLNYVEDTSEWLSKEIPVRVITVNASDRKLVLSAKELLQEQSATERNSRVASIPVGLVTEGTVDSLQTYGAFINLGNGLSGLVHISQISSKRIKSPAAVLHIGDTVKVKVIDTKDGKISLSMKALEEAISEEIVEESYDLPETEEVSTSLGSLFANIKLK
jgi:small subunit ribosomal protein S1